jgi:hypothetical protein
VACKWQIIGKPPETKRRICEKYVLFFVLYNMWLNANLIGAGDKKGINK